MMKFNPQKEPCGNLSDVAARHLREQIINGRLEPQEKLVESEIARQLGISRGPVRDALKLLTLEGLVDYQPNKGCTIARLSPRDAYEIFFMRGSLEKLALERCGCRLGDEALLCMDEALERMRVASQQHNTALTVAADEEFHRQIVVASRMERLLKMWELLSPLNGAMFLTVANANKLEAHLNAQNLLPANMKRGDNYGNHQHLLTLLRAGDLQGALDALDQHYIKTGERIYRLSMRQELSD